MKRCIKCGIEKSINDFPKRRDSPDGYRNSCKDCRREYLKQYHKNPPKKEVLESGFKRCWYCKKVLSVDKFSKNKRTKDGLRAECKKCKVIQNIEWRKNNPEYSKLYRQKNRERLRAKDRAYYYANKERRLKKRKKYAKEHSEAIARRKHEWYIKNKHRVMENKRRRRDRKLGCDENYTVADRKITLEAFGYKCFNCGSKENLHIDHHRPLAKGFGLDLDNAVVLCQSCNLSKSTKDPEEFYGKQKCAILDKKLASIKKQAIKEKKNDRIKQ